MFGGTFPPERDLRSRRLFAVEENVTPTKVSIYFVFAKSAFSNFKNLSPAWFASVVEPLFVRLSPCLGESLSLHNLFLSLHVLCCVLMFLVPGDRSSPFIPSWTVYLFLRVSKQTNATPFERRWP